VDDVVHEAVVHIPEVTDPKLIDGVASSTPKLRPRSVVDEKKAVAMFDGLKAVNAGASNENQRYAVPVIAPMVILTDFLTPNP
jgi:hypothetical protein